MNAESLLPPKPPVLVATGFDDDIHDLGDRIAQLTIKEAQEHGIKN